MINKLTEDWDRNEVVSIRIPVILDDLAARIEEPDFPMHLFFGFNYTTVFAMEFEEPWDCRGERARE